MLEVREVTKTFSGRAVVDRVSFDVQPGEIFALLGPNGAGKTTLIRMITDIIKPDAGTIQLDGHAVGGDGRRRIAYLPEERGLYRRAKVIEVLEYYGQLKGLPKAQAREDGMRLLERVELEDEALKQVQSMSKGMQQKLQLCTVLIGDPRVLILDEPFSGLDPINILLLEDILQERRADGATVMLSTHQMNKVESLCDRALMINNGLMVLYGEVGELRQRYADHAVMLKSPSRFREIPGVQAVEELGDVRKLTLEPDATPQTALRALIERGVEVESFSIATLPIEEVFVKVVREGLGLDQGASAAAEQADPATMGAP